MKAFYFTFNSTHFVNGKCVDKMYVLIRSYTLGTAAMLYLDSVEDYNLPSDWDRLRDADSFRKDGKSKMLTRLEIIKQEERQWY